MQKPNKKFKGLKESDWVRIEFQPSVQILSVYQIDGDTLCGDIDGDQGKSEHIEADEIKTITKITGPKEFKLGDTEFVVFEDGRVVIDGREYKKEEALKLFKSLGPMLGYDVAA